MHASKPPCAYQHQFDDEASRSDTSEDAAWRELKLSTWVYVLAAADGRTRSGTLVYEGRLRASWVGVRLSWVRVHTAEFDSIGTLRARR